jgi:hypothetical protein
MTSGPLHRLAIIAITVALAPVPTDTAAHTPASTPIWSADVTATSSRPYGEQTDPDVVADRVGGIASRLHTSDGAPVAGHLFLLMATAGSAASAQLFDDTPYTHDNGTPAETLASNIAAAELATTITGIDVELLDLTTAPGGGPSGGLIYTIAYLNVISDGAFTGDLRIAATGELAPDGYLDPITAINEKVAAAHLADADVLFSPSTPTADHIEEYGARHVGELFRARNTGSTLAEERRLDDYQAWGAGRPKGTDIVGTRHIADVAAYLCGAGSAYACEILEALADTVIGGPLPGEDHELRADVGASYA